MKRLLTVTLAISLATGIGVIAGCGAKEAPVRSDTYLGKYVSRTNKSNYIELRTNHTFTLVKNGQVTSGSYFAQKGKLSLSAGSYRDEMTISGKTITDKDGTQYLRDPGASPPADERKEEISRCKQAMIDFYLSDKPKDFTSDIWVAGLYMNEEMTQANGYVNGKTGPGAVNHGYSGIGQPIQSVPVYATRQGSKWVCSRSGKP